MVKSSFGKDRNGKEIQTGHKLDFHYKLKIVDNGIAYTNKTATPWHCEIKEGKKKCQTVELKKATARGTKPKKELSFICY